VWLFHFLSPFLSLVGGGKKNSRNSGTPRFAAAFPIEAERELGEDKKPGRRKGKKRKGGKEGKKGGVNPGWYHPSALSLIFYCRDGGSRCQREEHRKGERKNLGGGNGGEGKGKEKGKERERK